MVNLCVGASVSKQATIATQYFNCNCTAFGTEECRSIMLTQKQLDVFADIFSVTSGGTTTDASGTFYVSTVQVQQKVLYQATFDNIFLSVRSKPHTSCVTVLSTVPRSPGVPIVMLYDVKH